MKIADVVSTTPNVSALFADMANIISGQRELSITEVRAINDNFDMFESFEQELSFTSTHSLQLSQVCQLIESEDIERHGKTKFQMIMEHAQQDEDAYLLEQQVLSKGGNA